jgi:hypothetical protein
MSSTPVASRAWVAALPLRPGEAGTAAAAGEQFGARSVWVGMQGV